MLQPRGEEELHGDPKYPHKDEVGPFGGVGGELERDVGDEDEGESRNEGAPDGEEIDAEERVRALADPADSGVGAGGAKDAKKSDEDGGEALGGGDLVEVVRVGCRCGGDVERNRGIGGAAGE